MKVTVRGNQIETAIQELKGKLTQDRFFSEIKERCFYEKLSVRRKKKRAKDEYICQKRIRASADILWVSIAKDSSRGLRSFKKGWVICQGRDFFPDLWATLSILWDVARSANTAPKITRLPGTIAMSVNTRTVRAISPLMFIFPLLKWLGTHMALKGPMASLLAIKKLIF